MRAFHHFSPNSHGETLTEALTEALTASHRQRVRGHVSDRFIAHPYLTCSWLPESDMHALYGAGDKPVQPSSLSACLVVSTNHP